MPLFLKVLRSSKKAISLKKEIEECNKRNKMFQTFEKKEANKLPRKFKTIGKEKIFHALAKIDAVRLEAISILREIIMIQKNGNDAHRYFINLIIV